MATLVGSFAKPTGGNGSTHRISWSGTQVQFLRLWTAGQTSTDTFVSTVDLQFSMGWATTTQMMCAACFSDDAADPTDTYRAARASALAGITSAGTVLWEVTTVAFDGDGVLLTFGTNNAVATMICYEMISGQSLSNVTLGTHQMPATTGSFDIATGLSYVPSAIILMSIGLSGSSLPQAADSQLFGYGFATGSSNEFSNSFRAADNQGTSSSARLFNQTALLVLVDMSTTTISAVIELTSFNSVGNGITLNATTLTAGAASSLLMYATFGGGSWHANSFTTGSTGVTAPGFQPDGLHVISSLFITPGTVNNDSIMAIGATDGTTHRVSQFYDQHGQAAANIHTYLYTSGIAFNATTTTIDTAMGFTSFDANGFTVSRILGSSATRNQHYLAYHTGTAVSPSAGAATSYYYRELMV